MKKIEVVAAIIVHNNLICCAQRNENKFVYISNKFEFPGGKIEAGETKKEALQRELVEELNITPAVEDLYISVVHQYPDFELTMHAFLCKSNSVDITLNEHRLCKWLPIEELNQLDWAAADLPIVEKLMKVGV